MIDIIMFVIANIVVSNFLEKHKYRVATIAHTVMFIIVLTVMVLVTYSNLFGSLITQISGTCEGFQLLVDVLRSAGVLETTSVIALMIQLSKLFVTFILALGIFKFVCNYSVTITKRLVSADQNDLNDTNETIDGVFNCHTKHLVAMRC